MLVRSESGDINAEEPATAHPKMDAGSTDQTMGAKAAADSFEEHSHDPVDAIDTNAAEELNCYDPYDPSTNIASEQESAETSDDERYDASSLRKKFDLTKDFSNDLPSEQSVPQEFIETQIDQLRKTHFLVLYSKTWDVVESIAYALARRWSDAVHFRYYIPDANTTTAAPFSLRDVVERLTESGLLIVFDNSQFIFSPLISRAYIGPDAHELLNELKKREVYMLVLSTYDTVEHVRKEQTASGLIKYFLLVESQEHETSETKRLPDVAGVLHLEALVLVWCAAFFPELSVDDIFVIVNRMIENAIKDPRLAQASKDKLRCDWTEICAGWGLTIAADATGIAHFKFGLSHSAAKLQLLFRTQGRLHHIYALQLFLESCAMLDLKGRPLQVAAACIASLAKSDPSALGENVLLRSVTSSRSHPDIAQWWESDDFDHPPIALLNLLQAELVSLVRLGHSQLAAAALKVLSRLRVSLVIALLNRCPGDYVYESWYLDAYIDILRHVSKQHVRLKGLRRLIRIASRKSHVDPERADPSAAASLAQLTAAIYRSAIQPVCGDYHSCFIDTVLLGQQEQRETIHELLCSSAYSEDMAKAFSGPLRSQILLQSLSGWNWTASRSKIDMWVKQRLLAEGPPVQVFAATSALFGQQRDAADAEMKPASTSFGVVLALLLLDHDAAISRKPDGANASQEIPVALKILFAQEEAALRETAVALAELSRHFSACSSRVNTVTVRAGRQELETFSKIRRSLNRHAGAAISLKKFIDKEARN
jgi:hypothetical protein